MNRIDDSLMTGETVLFSSRVSLGVLPVPLLGACVLALMTMWSIRGLSAMMSGWPPEMVAAPLLAAGMVWLLWVVNTIRFLWPLVGQQAVVTQTRLFVRRGLFAIEQKDLPLSRIESVEVRQSLLGRVMHYGDVIVTGVGSQFLFAAGIANPSCFRACILSSQGSAGSRTEQVRCS